MGGHWGVLGGGGHLPTSQTGGWEVLTREKNNSRKLQENRRFIKTRG